MNPEAPRRDDDIETLIRRHLREEERLVDPRGILDRVQAKLVAVEPTNVLRGFGRHFTSRRALATMRWGVGAVAALLLIGFVWTFRQASAHADAVKLVREARGALESHPDRSYRMEIVLAPGMAEEAPLLAALASFDRRLWTRSDRFWIDVRGATQCWAFGRDERRHVWIASTPDLGLDFAPEEVPEPLDMALDLFSLDLDTVLKLLSTEFDVTVDRDGSQVPPGVTRIRGTPKPNRPRPRLRSIVVEIDEQTKIVRHVLLARVRKGRPLADVSFTFDRDGVEPDSAYRLSSHLNTDASILGSDRWLRRRRELVRFFGSLMLKGE